MNDAPILVCYDGAPAAVGAIASAATLAGPRGADAGRVAGRGATNGGYATYSHGGWGSVCASESKLIGAA